MRCPKCERELPESVKYCVYCSNILFKECPSCKRKIGFDKRVCEFCGLDIAQYEQGKKLLEEGKKLEQNWKYEEAKAQYEEIQGLPVIADEASKLLDAVLQKIKVINEQQFEGEKFLKTRLACAYRAFLRVQDLLPENEDIANKLEAIKVRLKWRAKKVWVGIGIIVIVGLGGTFYWRTNTLPVLARRGLETLLGSESLEIKNSAALVLGWHGGKTGIPVLELLANSGNEKKRVYSLSALIELNETQSVGKMREFIRGGRDVASRIAAAWSMVDFGDTTIIPELVVYLNEEDESLKMAAAVLLFNLGYSVGVPIMEEALKSGTREEKFKVLYSLYLLGDKKMLRWYEKDWTPVIRNLLWDPTPEVKVLSAFLLKEFSTGLTSQDSLAIAKILWEEFISNKSQTIILKVEEIPEINGFYVAKGIINKRGDEDIVKFSPSADAIRRKCWTALSRIELKDKTAMKEIESALNSTDKYERLYAALVMLKCGKKEAVTILKELIKDKDDFLKLNTCKLVFEFI